MYKLANILKSYITLIVVLIYLAFTSQAFFGIENIKNIMRLGSLLAILATAQAIVMISADDGIDLSLGANMAFSGYLAAIFIIQGYTLLGIGVGLVSGALIGFSNGFLISRLSVPPFAATFGVSFISRGIAFIIADGRIIYDFPQSFRTVSLDSFLGIPILVYIMVFIVLLMWFFMDKTNLGRNIYCIGSNRDAATICGVKYKKTIIMAYTIAGIIASMTGMLYIARLNAAETVFGGEFPLQTVAACILAGIGAGRGKIFECVVGAYTLTVIANGMNLLAISQYWQDTVFGMVLLFGFLLNFVLQTTQKRLLDKKLKMEFGNAEN